MVKTFEWLCGSRLDLDPKLASKPLPHVNGINGLSNHHGTCDLNTALQLLAQTVKIHLEQGDCSENSENYKMIEAISATMPTLIASYHLSLLA